MTGSPAALRHPLAGLSPRLRRKLVVLFVGRGVGAWTLRFAYPFLPTIARGLGLSLKATGLLFGAVELLGVLSPAIGHLLDRGDQRTGLIVGSATLGVGGVVAGLAPGVAGFSAGLLTIGVGFMVYMVASSSWAGSRVPIEQRGGAIGMLETSWALSFLIGVPAAAAMVTAGSWRTPFLVIGLVNLAIAVAIWFTIEPGVEHPQPPADLQSRRGRRPWAFAATLGLIGLGGMMVIGTYGAWLEAEHGFDVGGIGMLAILLGAAELAGSTFSMLWGDRIGLRRTMTIGLVLLAPALVLTAPLGSGALGALAALFAVFAAFEISFVSALTIASELDTEARGAAIGLAIAGATIGRAAGVAGGVWLLVNYGMATAGAVGAVAALGALALSRRSIPAAAAP